MFSLRRWPISYEYSGTEEMRVPSSMPFYELVNGLRKVKWMSVYVKWMGSENNELSVLDSFWGLDASVAVPEGWHKLETEVLLAFQTRISPKSDQTRGAFMATYGGTMLILQQTTRS